ncbi:uncharacterized protein TRAVEDRAFT_21404 [Trametes versicolor FP-101664 SS1]|uniref:uncharacterized protein n=1 Tax=Trametes versicolor (strain FP-101664) TaxID=717944 RepID=UPI0004624063|nr:uncharacterized protein TRAVEDRAFT_21404 [Trametes versicolor FP-101664 SS1]EIW57946.1 hypothetical protein TRAVEDRAFT_21404 [Trametes versicolor FP-101664 SS1]
MATVSNITSSTDAVSEQKLAVDTSSNDSSNYAAMAEQVAQALLEPENRGVETINRLVKAVNGIKGMSQKLALTFIAFDDAGVLDEHGNALRLASQWRTYHERLLTLIQRSRDNAASAAALTQLYGLAVQAVVDQSSYNQLYAGLEAFPQESDQKAAAMRQSCDDFADLVKDVSQFAQGAVQRGSTRLDGDTVENTSRAVQNLADKIDAIAQVWGYFTLRKLTTVRDGYVELAGRLEAYVKGTMNDDLYN